MINVKPSDARWIVPVADPALFVLGEKAINDYTLDRDLEKLGVDTDTGAIKGTKELVTLFKVRPLKSESFHLIEMGITAFREIFRSHVIAAKNFPEWRINTVDGKTDIPDSVLDKVDHEVMMEVVGIIIELGNGRNGDDRAFSSGASSRQQRIRSRQLHANIARIDPAKVTKRDTDSDAP